MSKQLQENDILEYLNTSLTVRGFFICTVDVFERAIQTLIERIFLKNDFAVQSVVGPLLQNTGPLGELSVRLKLLFGLGVIGQDTYHDIEGIIKLKNLLNNDSTDYSFTDPVIVNAIQTLHLAKNMLPIMALDSAQSAQDDCDLAFYQMQVDRNQKVVKSSLALAIISLCEELDKESPF